METTEQYYTDQFYRDCNKIIAEYVGARCSEPYSYNKDTGYHTYHFEFPIKGQGSYPGNEKHHTISSLRYHESMDWLMPVWIKIMQWGKEQHGYHWEQEIKEDSAQLKSPNFNYAWFMKGGTSNDELLKCVYVVTVEFIKWFNEQNII